MYPRRTLQNSNVLFFSSLSLCLWLCAALIASHFNLLKFFDAARHAQPIGNLRAAYPIIIQKKDSDMCSGSIRPPGENGKPGSNTEEVLELFNATWYARAIVCLSFGQMVRICAGDLCGTRRIWERVGCTEAMEGAEVFFMVFVFLLLA